ncbi:DUF4124 domain-containing protein [Thalassolituus sp.]|jgi:hypothetical protein|uniref:DUF4124 domain-containing protein n=1 Tax=Thalassolituus sp. TaxID=2030822 RepID=UPI0032D918F9
MKDRKFNTVHLVVLSTVFVSQFTLAQVYQWTDENGRKHFSDVSPSHSSFESVDVAPTNSMDSPSSTHRTYNGRNYEPDNSYEDSMRDVKLRQEAELKMKKERACQRARERQRDIDGKVRRGGQPNLDALKNRRREINNAKADVKASCY